MLAAWRVISGWRWLGWVDILCNNLTAAANVSLGREVNSSATCRLNAELCDRCFVMASILRKPSEGGGQFKSPILSTQIVAAQVGQSRTPPNDALRERQEAQFGQNK